MGLGRLYIVRHPPTVVLVIGSLARGGTERQIREFVRAAHPSFARCRVICLSANEGAFAADVRATGATVRTMGFVGFDWKSPAQALRSFRAVWRLFRLLRREQPDVVYGFLFWGYVLGLLVAKLAAPRALRVAGLRSAPELDYPSKTLEPLRRFALATADGAITNARPDAWAARYPNLRKTIIRIPNGVRVSASGSGAPTSGQIVCVANLKPVKGHAILLRALASLPPRLDWKLQLCGEGPQRSALEHEADELGLDGRVEFLGSVRDVDGILEQAELAVLASHSENLPNAVLEAMAYGIPVVATTVGDVPQLLRGGAGTLVAPGDPNALATAIRRYLEDRQLRQRAGAAGRREIERGYSVEALRDRTLAAFTAFRERRG
jgi:glycosyltransferase involved in cell wall biosynthesis